MKAHWFFFNGNSYLDMEGIEYENIISKYVADPDDVFVMKFPCNFSRNIKVPPITTRYYVISKVKLTIPQVFWAINDYERKLNDRPDP